MSGSSFPSRYIVRMKIGAELRHLTQLRGVIVLSKSKVTNNFPSPGIGVSASGSEGSSFSGVLNGCSSFR